jgi:hypothetical protein
MKKTLLVAALVMMTIAIAACGGGRSQISGTNTPAPTATTPAPTQVQPTQVQPTQVQPTPTTIAPTVNPLAHINPADRNCLLTSATPLNTWDPPTGGFPSDALAVLYGDSTFEGDSVYGRNFVVRGGEANQTTGNSPQNVTIVPLASNVRAFATYYSNPAQNVIEPNGDPLEVLHIETISGEGRIFVRIFQNNVEVASIDANVEMRPGFSNPVWQNATITGLFDSYNVDNLSGVGIPIADLANGCWRVEIEVRAPQQSTVEIGIGTSQTRYTAVAVFRQ